MIPKIVFINGPSGAGKDVLATAMYLRREYFNRPIHTMKFAEPLKLAVHAMYGHLDSFNNIVDLSTTPYVQVYGPAWFKDEMFIPQDVFFGKTPEYVYDVFGKALNGECDPLHFDQIAAIHALFGLYLTKPSINDSALDHGNKYYVYVLKADFFETTKNLNSYLFKGSNPRSEYINLSEKVVKPNFDDQFFGKIFVNNLKIYLEEAKHSPLIFVSDSGFESEALPVIAEFGADNCLLLTIYAEARGRTFKGDSRSYIKLPIETYAIYNNTHNVTEAFFDETETIITSWLKGK